MDCVILEGHSLALFTVLKNSPRNVRSGGILTAYKAYKICPLLVVKQSHYYSRFFLRKHRLITRGALSRAQRAQFLKYA